MAESNETKPTPKKKAAKKQPAKKKARSRKPAATSTRPAKSPGPGTDWKHTSPAEIQAFRERNGLTEAATARVLSVSVGTLRNWTLQGKSAMGRTQRRVKRAMEAYTPGARPARDDTRRTLAAPVAARRRPSGGSHPGSAIVGEIVVAYIRQGGKVEGELIQYIGRVKQALGM